jgi:hypothetical protein
VEADFATRYPERFREDTVELVADLLEALRRELERVKADLGALLAQGQSAPLELGFTVRRMRPVATESPGAALPGPAAGLGLEGEGSPSSDAPAREQEPAQAPRPTGVEVAFVLKVDVEGFIRAERVVLVQVVKLEQRGEGQWMPSFRLGREQVDALLLRTDAAFCLFLAPPFPRAECWMVPARMVRGMMEAQRSLSGVARDGVQRVGRSFSHWLVADLMGLWTGDERPELLEPAGTDFVVELGLR